MVRAGISLPKSHLINAFVAEHQSERGQEIVLISAGAKVCTNVPGEEQTALTADCPPALLLAGRDERRDNLEGNGLTEKGHN